MLPNERPPRTARQDKESDTTRRKVLLEADSPVGCEQQLEARIFGGVKQRAVVERIPASGLRRVDGVPGKRTG
jgi:hypothetical protein